MNSRMKIALVAHDDRKKEMLDWVEYNKELLANHKIYATGTTGSMIQKQTPELTVHKLLSGPLGGDQQIGTKIAQGEIDVLIFFCDNLITQGHQQDVGALVRLASLYNIAFATNRTTADMILTSNLFANPNYEMTLPEVITNYTNRFEK